MYQAIFSRRAEKAFLKLPHREAQRIKESIEKLKREPRTHGTIKLESAPVASYRYRIGDNRILFDIDHEAKVIEILDIRKRDERTYR
jgi:mRNA interferase RelE/StbE